MNLLSKMRRLTSELQVDVFTIDFDIITFLFCNGKSGIEDIRRNVRGSPGAVSYKIRSMVEAGVVIRQTSEVDARASFYELSARALEMLNPIAFPTAGEPRASRAA